MSSPTVELAPAKLTASLRVVGRRPDGYHLIESEMLSLDLSDELTFAEGEGLQVQSRVQYLGDDASSALDVPLGEDNLVSRALRIVGERRRVVIAKAIPPGAGLGGGSSNAAAVLRHFGDLDVGDALKLGADVPFCLRGGRAMVRGIGEDLEALAYEPRTFVLVTPDFGVSTVAVYRRFDEIGSGDHQTSNDLQAAAMTVEPRLRHVHDVVASTGLEPVLAGSGSTLFVEVSDTDAAEVADQLRSALVKARVRAVLNVARSVPATGR